jgi:phosphoserine phosphatase
MFTATLIAAESLRAGDVSDLEDRLSAVASITGRGPIRAGKAADLQFEGDAALARAALEAMIEGVDIIVQPTSHRHRHLLVADMDSTMITVECIDELADYAGIKQQIAEITERAMRGELEFESALRERVALLEGLAEDVIEQCLRERVEITSGARELVASVRARGGHTILVSGGFTRFAEPVAATIGFDHVVANKLEIRDGRLTGRVQGDIVGAAAKREALLAAAAERNLLPEHTIAIGDGANDIPMIEAAGLGVAYHAKPKTREAAGAAVLYGNLEAVMWAMGPNP